MGQGHPVADVDAVDAAANMIAALALPDFYSGSVANPALQRHYEVRDSGVAGFSRTGLFTVCFQSTQRRRKPVAFLGFTADCAPKAQGLWTLSCCYTLTSV